MQARCGRLVTGIIRLRDDLCTWIPYHTVDGTEKVTSSRVAVFWMETPPDLFAVGESRFSTLK